MDLEIEPDPTAEEREAIEAALAKLLSPRRRPVGYDSAWRKAALTEGVEDQAAARPRSKRGASRA